MRAKQAARSESAVKARAAVEQRGPLQRDVLRDVMLSAGECDTWLTLEELARTTSYPPASISAQLRHLRKSEHGGYRLDKRCRMLRKNLAGVQSQTVSGGPVWEYKLGRRRFITQGVRLTGKSFRGLDVRGLRRLRDLRYRGDLRDRAADRQPSA